MSYFTSYPTRFLSALTVGDFGEKSIVKSLAERIAGLDYKRDISPPPRSPIGDMSIVAKMKSIQTDVGRARAWVRLAIEKRLLSHHLSLITSNPVIVDELYKRYGLLQCREGTRTKFCLKLWLIFSKFFFVILWSEWDQCLFHLLALGKTQDVEFHCFTHAYPKAVFLYRVWIFPGATLIGVSETTANIYIRIVGEKVLVRYFRLQNIFSLKIRKWRLQNVDPSKRMRQESSRSPTRRHSKSNSQRRIWVVLSRSPLDMTTRACFPRGRWKMCSCAMRWRAQCGTFRVANDWASQAVMALWSASCPPNVSVSKWAEKGESLFRTGMARYRMMITVTWYFILDMAIYFDMLDQYDSHNERSSNSLKSHEILIPFC